MNSSDYPLFSQPITFFAMPRIAFAPDRAEPTNAIVVSFDLSGFSDFCSRADAHVVLPKFLSHLFDEVNEFLMGQISAALEKLGEFLGSTAERQKVVRPEFIKFTGDGALLIWLPGIDGKFSEAFCTAIVTAMRGLQSRIAEKVPKWEKSWRVVGLPKRARFGIAGGQVYALRDPTALPIAGPSDYVGYCINLAVRLQNHCPEVGFLVHESLHPNKGDFIRLEALGMKGTRTEPVLAFSADLEGMKEGYFKTKFRRI